MPNFRFNTQVAQPRGQVGRKKMRGGGMGGRTGRHDVFAWTRDEHEIQKNAN